MRKYQHVHRRFFLQVRNNMLKKIPKNEKWSILWLLTHMAHLGSFLVPSNRGCPPLYTFFYDRACSVWTLVQERSSFLLLQAGPNQSLQQPLFGSVRITGTVRQVSSVGCMLYIYEYWDVFWPLGQSSCASSDPDEWHSLNEGKPGLDRENKCIWILTIASDLCLCIYEFGKRVKIWCKDFHIFLHCWISHHYVPFQRQCPWHSSL